MRWAVKRVLWWRKPAYTCADIAAVLQSYLDGEVDTETAASVARHLDVCGGCEEEARAYQTVILRLRQADARQIDPSVVAALGQFGRSLVDGDGPLPTDI